jgi:hypothetical protein
MAVTIVNVLPIIHRLQRHDDLTVRHVCRAGSLNGKRAMSRQVQKPGSSSFYSGFRRRDPRPALSFLVLLVLLVAVIHSHSVSIH